MKKFWIVISLAIIGFAVAFAAEIAIDSAIHTTLTSHNGSSPTAVFTSDQTGYAFYRDSTGSCVYSKTSDGGGSWGVAVTVDAQTDCLKVAVWYDRWTPGDTTGNYIHITTLDAADLWYTRLDTSGDTLTATVNASGANQGGGFAVGANIPSITKGTDGDLYMGVQDAGDSFVIKCATGADCSSAINWTEAGTIPFDLATDWLILMPLSGGNIMAIRWDISADAVQSKIYSDSGNSWDGAWTTIDASAVSNGTYDAHFGATLKRSTGDIYLAYATDVVTFGTNDDIRAATYSGGAWTSKTDVLTNDTKGITGVKMGFDENTNEIYAVYTARTTSGTASTGNVYWKKSADVMASWGTEQSSINTTAGDLYGARVNIMSDERIYVTWDLASADDLLGNTIVDLASGGDTTAPADVSNLATGAVTTSSIVVTWTAPGDDASSGTATTYDLRYSTSAITSGNFDSATQVTGEPTPSVAGSSETKTVTGLSSGTTYYFALKTSDEVPNTSAISNVPSGTTSTSGGGDTTAPADVSNLATGAVTTSSIVVTWTAPGDDASSGTATTYDLRYSTSAITSGNFDSATQVTGEPTPSVAGSSETKTVTGLSSGTTYYFALKTSDEVPNTSAISNVPSGTTSTETTSSITIPPDSLSRGGVLPTEIIFAGKAYPGGTVRFYRRSSIDVQNINTYILDTETVADDGGFFEKKFTALLQGEYFFAVEAKDKNGRSSGISGFTADLISSNSLKAENLFVPPTLDFIQNRVSRGKPVTAIGYTFPASKVELLIDNVLRYSTEAAKDGAYSLAIETARFSPREHFLRARAIGPNDEASGFSSIKTFVISPLSYPQADFDGDSIINIKDWSVFLFRWRSADMALKRTADLDGNKIVDIKDLSIFLTAIKGL